MPHDKWTLADARTNAVEKLLRTEEVRTRRPRWSFSYGAYLVECYRGNLVHELYDEEDSPRRRNLYISVRLAGVVVSVGHLLEWNVPFGATPFDFWWAADAVSQEEADVAYMLASYWSFDEWPADFGSIVLFNRLAIQTANDFERSALATIRVAIERELRVRASILLLKAFPLEYEAQPDAVDRTLGLRNRQRAMMRWYGRQLGVHPFVDQTRFRGWMWRPLRYCPPPTTALPDEAWLPD